MSDARYFVDEHGVFLGGFSGIDLENAIQVPSAPLDARQIWDFSTGTFGAIPLPRLMPVVPVDFKLGMLTLNITPDQIDAAIDAMQDPDRILARIYWTSAQEFVREDPLIADIAAVFSKTDEEIDGAWRYAMSLPKTIFPSDGSAG
jgi:hypothetical protein